LEEGQAAVTYFIAQGNWDGHWVKDDLEVVQWLCDHFGWKFEQVYQSLFDQIERAGFRPLIHEDLALVIQRMS
jgi:hypothetical protein